LRGLLMGTRDPRIDAYIARQKDFAKPILIHIRDVVHAACPDVVETVKWSSPFFDYNGSVVCSMAGFKEHAVLRFWKASLIEGLGPDSAKAGEAAGNFGRLTSVNDLPSKRILTGYLEAAMKLNDGGVVVVRTKSTDMPSATIPNELAAALATNKKAKAAFETLSPSQRREYSEWIADAKREETKAKRVAQAVEWIADGKSRHWKYHS
ncbi:MAG: YdeI/OmpD-associated family protein, partial [bacterium]